MAVVVTVVVVQDMVCHNPANYKRASARYTPGNTRTSADARFLDTYYCPTWLSMTWFSTIRTYTAGARHSPYPHSAFVSLLLCSASFQLLLADPGAQRHGRVRWFGPGAQRRDRERRTYAHARYLRRAYYSTHPNPPGAFGLDGPWCPPRKASKMPAMPGIARNELLMHFRELGPRRPKTREYH